MTYLAATYGQLGLKKIGFGGPVLARISGTFARVKPLRGLEALPRLDLG